MILWLFIVFLIVKHVYILSGVSIRQKIRHFCNFFSRQILAGWSTTLVRMFNHLPLVCNLQHSCNETATSGVCNFSEVSHLYQTCNRYTKLAKKAPKGRTLSGGVKSAGTGVLLSYIRKAVRVLNSKIYMS